MKSLTVNEKQIVIDSLNMRKNLIETGNPVISKIDALSMRKHKIIKKLHLEQLDFIRNIEQLIMRFTNFKE